MNDKLKPELMKLLDITDEKVADKILHYAKLVNDGTTTMLVNSDGKKQAQNLLDTLRANDFAVAKALNERVTTIFDMFARNNTRSLDITAINKSYVLLVNSLKKIYARNDELSAIDRKPIWEYFDIIEGCEHEISDYTNDWNNDTGQSHIARVNKLCIVAGKENPDYTPELKQIVENADKAITAFSAVLEENEPEQDNDWTIPEYYLIYKDDGTILINGVMKLRKTQAGQASDMIMSQSLAHDSNKEPFKPELSTNRPLTTIIGDMGFDKTLRAIFFPTISKDKGLAFRSRISREQADAQHIDTKQLDRKLKGLKAEVTYKGISLNDIPF
ncbi:MAG TPA: hypothetical protein PJ984_00970 [Candidatus Saccharibacteria bacterium]|nr:hypothetical protein [Candidatus Saccharibacteria bacterium]